MEVPQNKTKSFDKYTGEVVCKVSLDKDAIAKGNLYTQHVEQGVKPYYKLRIPFIFTTPEGIKLNYSIWLENRPSIEGLPIKEEVNENGNPIIKVVGRQIRHVNQVGRTFDVANEGLLKEGHIGKPETWFTALYSGAKDNRIFVANLDHWVSTQGEGSLYSLLRAVTNLKVDSIDPIANIKLDMKKLYKTTPDFKEIEFLLNLNVDDKDEQLGVKVVSYINDKGYMTIFSPKYAEHIFPYYTKFNLEWVEKASKPVERFINQIINKDNAKYGILDKLANGLTWTKVPTDWKPGTKQVTNPEEIYTTSEIPKNDSDPDMEF